MTNEPHTPAPEKVSDEARYLIRKYSGYYRPNSQGYTGSAIQAGRYTLAEAESITHPNGPDGPRDGMSYVHEDDFKDEDWTAYRALRTALTAAEGERDKMRVNLEHWRQEVGKLHSRVATLEADGIAARKAAAENYARAEAAEAQSAERDAELATVLAREADTIRRHDTKLGAMEVDRDAAIAAAYEAAAREIDCQGCRGSCGDPANCHAEYAKDIRALTPSDALAALERVKAEARGDVAGLAEALRDAMSALDYVRFHYGDLYGVGFDRVRDVGDAALAAWEGRE
jgi:hypothetical protein